MKKFIVISCSFLSFYYSFSQNFTRKDSLLGGLRIERTSFDVLRYDLNITVNPVNKLIFGSNDITFKVVENTSRIQLDLFENMKIDSIVSNSRKLNYKREFDAVFIDFPDLLTTDSQHKIQFYYSGNPLTAKKAPWDGGFVFKKDSNGNDWIGVAVQSVGASLWIPCKDSQSDEPDFGASIKIAVPNGLMNVSNGRFIGKVDLNNGCTRWDWEVKNPINMYDVTLNIGDYIHFGEKYKGLDLDYYVLRDNEQKARLQFEEVKPMMDCFQSKFGIYPFAEDGFKLVETSYLGMEHQSAVAYGNKYKKGYLGYDNSNTGIGMRFDYIIIHESAHEWFGNSITSKDIADMWIHEGFTCYAESVYVECVYGYDDAQLYINGLKRNISNDKPIISSFGVNSVGSNDMYYKGALMLNTIRHILNNDAKWWKLILDYSNTFKHKIIDTQAVLSFFNAETKLDFTTVFDQYLRTKNIPILEIRKNKDKLQYRWITDVSDFTMPVEIEFNRKNIRLNPSNEWKNSTFSIKNLKDINVRTDKFLIKVIRN